MYLTETSELYNNYMPVLFLVIRIQSVCRKAILICLNPIVAGVSFCDRRYHVYGGITFFEGSAPKMEVKKGPDFFKDFILYVHHYLECVISWRADRDAAFSFCGDSSVEMVSCITTLILTASHPGYSSAYAIFKCRLLI